VSAPLNDPRGPADHAHVRSSVEIPVGLMRARRTAAAARAAIGFGGVLFAMAPHHHTLHDYLALVGFSVIFATGLVQLLAPRVDWLKLEESLAPVSAVLIVGFGTERVSAVSVLWLGAVASGVLARGGRQYWIGRALLLISLALPIARSLQLSLAYACLVVTAIALLLTCGRVTRELREMLDRARYDADHDELTGALSRAAFRARLDRVAADLASLETSIAPPSAAPDQTALLLLDVDNFGAVNKAHGHAAGDGVLRGIVDQMRAAVGAEGTVGRLGGDEFAAIVTAPDPEALARRLLADVVSASVTAPAGDRAAPAGDRATPDRPAGPMVQASVGMAFIPHDGDDAESLLRAVDVALRVAKRSGNHQLSVYAGESISDRGPGGAREALERLIGGEGLAMAVQPIVAVSRGTAHAYEALARFQTGGSPNPLHWFALADEFGVRDRLELACLRTALSLLGARPPGTSLSVNLSGPLLLDPRAIGLLESTPGLDGLILELTENSLLEDTPGMHAQISRLLALGVRFAVDDMGAGYSGLRQITTVRPSYLKLDRSLISGIDGDSDRGALVSAMLGYARQTGGHLVAEGVETAAELETLVALGVELVQGFYLGRPGPPWPAVTSRPAPRPAGRAAPAPPSIGVAA
jgi:diguanylate cyclase (GGDEF)-like protein